MRALVISDIHGNIEALRALDAHWGPRLREFDRVICLGDLVDYGPDPGAVIDWMESHATNVVRGNHDHAVATGESGRSAPAFLEASVVTRARLQPTISAHQIAYLNALPLTDTVTEVGPSGDATWHLVHASPIDPLYAYMPPTRTDEEWSKALDGRNGQTVLIGHTHLAFVRSVADGVVINPGSLGMPKDGEPHGSYAIIDGRPVQFCRVAYDPESVIARLRPLDLPAHVFDQLARAFRTGT